MEHVTVQNILSGRRRCQEDSWDALVNMYLSVIDRLPAEMNVGGALLPGVFQNLTRPY
jgi:hypothetical protein